MQKTTHKSNSKGFTIIEVLIVLAIAGLILLVVFLAVPALNRNSRNTSIKTDAQNVLGGVSEYRGAKDGINPASLDVATAGEVKYKDSTSVITSIKTQGSTKVAVGTAVPAISTSTTDATNIAPGGIVVVLGNKCASDTALTASTRSVAAFYLVETSGEPVLKCVDG